MAKAKLDLSGRTWTYGAEHEFADWDTTKGWEGFGRDPEPNICNSNGIAADPRLISYKFGGEINTPPTKTVIEQGDLLEKFLRMHPNAKANWRCGLHIHIRVPGLATHLPTLKKLQRYIFENREVYDKVDPLPVATLKEFPDAEEFKAAKRRYNWMRMSHFTVIPEYRIVKQEAAKTVEEFHANEVPLSKAGKPLWHAQPRAAINLRQLLQTETIEFRHFPATTDPTEVITATTWCRDYLMSCFQGMSAVRLFDDYYAKRKFPTLKTIYCHWQEQRWYNTSIAKQSRENVEKNVARYLEEDRNGLTDRRR